MTGCDVVATAVDLGFSAFVGFALGLLVVVAVGLILNRIING